MFYPIPTEAQSSLQVGAALVTVILSVVLLLPVAYCIPMSCNLGPLLTSCLDNSLPNTFAIEPEEQPCNFH